MVDKQMRNVKYYAPLVGRLINWIILGLVICVVGLAIYWLVYPYKTTSYSDVPFKLSKTTYVQGEDAHYHVSYCKYTDLVPTVRRYFVDGLKIQATENEANFIQGCHNNQEIHFTIPESLPPGRWKLVVEATYKFNPLREQVTNTHSTEWFNVDRSDTGAYGGDKVDAVKP